MNRGPLLIGGGLLFCIILSILVVVMTKNGGGDAPPEPEQEPILTPEPAFTEEEEDVSIEPSTPSDPYESATWEEAKKTSVPGYAKVEGTVAHVPVGETWHLVGKERAPSQRDCWEFSKKNKINTWAWRKNEKSCWAYQDSFIYQGGMQPGSGTNDAHISGCTLPDRKLVDGCEDLNRGDIVLGHKGGAKFVGKQPFESKKMSLKRCREVVKEANRKALEGGADNDTVYAVGYRTNKHPNNDWTNTCFVYGNPRKDLKGWFGSQSDQAHVTACVDPTKKVREGCV